MSNISNLVKTVNSKLTEGYSIAAIEREFKLGKDTLRKQLNRAGYKYVKEKKLFVFNESLNNEKGVTQTITHNKNIDDNTNATQSITQANTRNNQPSQNKHKCNTITTQSENAGYNTSITQDATQLNPVKNKQSKVQHKCNTYITQTENLEHNTSVTQDITQNNQDKKIIQLQSFSPEDISIIFELIQNYKLKNKVNNLKYEKNESEIITRSFRSYKNVLDSFSDFCKEKNLSQKDAVADALMLYMKTAE